MESEQIKSTTLLGFEELVTELGGNPDHLFKTANIPSQLLLQPDAFIPFKSYCLLMEQAAQNTQRAEFGLLLGKKQSLSALGAVGSAIRHSQTSAESLSIIKRYFHTHSHCTSISMNSYGAMMQVTHTTVTKTEYKHTQAKMKSIASAISILKGLYGERWSPVEIWFDFCSIGNKSTFENILQAPVKFDQPESSIIVQSELLTADFSDANRDPLLKNILLQYLDEQADEQRLDFSTIVLGLIKSTLATGECSKENISSMLSIAPRTLQRKLTEEKTSFRLLVDKARKNCVKHYLSSTELSITEISEIIGYTEISTFSRAFKKWFGISPQAWRTENVKKV